jgi:hypothetical protein
VPPRTCSGGGGSRPSRACARRGAGRPKGARAAGAHTGKGRAEPGRTARGGRAAALVAAEAGGRPRAASRKGLQSCGKLLAPALGRAAARGPAAGRPFLGSSGGVLEGKGRDRCARRGTHQADGAGGAGGLTWVGEARSLQPRQCLQRRWSSGIQGGRAAGQACAAGPNLEPSAGLVVGLQPRLDSAVPKKPKRKSRGQCGGPRGAGKG